MANPEDSKTGLSHCGHPSENESLHERVKGITTDGLGSEKLMEAYSKWAEDYEKVFGIRTLFSIEFHL